MVLRQGSHLGQRERFRGVRRSVLFFTMFRNTSMLCVCVCVCVCVCGGGGGGGGGGGEDINIM